MSGSILSEIRLGRVVIGHHLKTSCIDNRDANNKRKSELAESIAGKCREKGWSVTVHRYPENGYCSELDGNWAYPISINDGGTTYTYVIFSMTDLDGNYGSPFYNSRYCCSSHFGGINHHAMSAWSKYGEFTEIVKDVFGECYEIEHFVRTK